MDEYEDLDTYNGDTEHDMWVDFDYNESTGELSVIDSSLAEQDILDDTDLDQFIDNLNDWD